MSDDETTRPRKKRKRAPAEANAETTPATEERVARAEVAPVAPVAPRKASPSAESVYRPLLASAVAAAVGLAIVGTSVETVGPWVLAAGLIGLVASIHRLGRLGPA